MPSASTARWARRETSTSSPQRCARHVGLPWVNTIAADSAGNAFYGDIGSMPNASNAKLAACIKPGVVAGAGRAARLYALDGSTSACDLGTDADAPEPGIFGAGNMPGLMRRDFVQNSNDSYWLANPAARLEGFSQHHRRRREPRRRVSARGSASRRSATARPAATGCLATASVASGCRTCCYGNRHYSAEIMLDGVLQLCALAEPRPSWSAAQPVERGTGVCRACAPGTAATTPRAWGRMSGPSCGARGGIAGSACRRSARLCRAIRRGRPGEHAARPEHGERRAS